MFTPILVRLKALIFRRAVDAELEEELRSHIERETERYIANGMTPAAARDTARRAFGNVSVAREQARDAMRWPMLEELGQDVAYAVRTCRRAPTFVLTVVATIGLGLGLLTTAFTLFDAYVLRPTAVRDPSSLYDMAWRARNRDWHRFTWAQYRSLKERTIVGQPFAYTNFQAQFRGQPAIGQLVSGDYFRTLGVPAALGRTLQPEDSDAPGGNPVIVLAYDTWQTMFGADSSVVGRRVTLNGISLRIVGVTRKGFGGLESVPFQFWAPITMIGLLDPSRDIFAPKPAEALRIIGRIRPGESVEQAKYDLLAWLRTTTADRPPSQGAVEVVLASRATSIPLTPEAIAVLSPIAIAFLLVMLIACANVANVMLARGMARQREIGIRLAMGAGRGRLIRQLLTESVVLSVPSAVAGYLVSRAAINAGLYLMFVTTPVSYRAYLRPMPLTPDTRIVVFVMAAAVIAAVVFGLAPALQATRPSVVQATRGDFDSNLRPSKMRSGLVVAQITASVLLLVCAGLLLRAARNTRSLSPGIRVHNIVQVELLDRRRAQAIEELRRTPAIRYVASASSPPLDGVFPDLYAAPAGAPSTRIKFNVVSPEYFGALDIPMTRGRNFSANEALARASVVIVSDATAGALWPGRDPIGQQLVLAPSALENGRLARYHSATVVGVVPDVRAGWIGLPADLPVVYYPQAADAAGSTIIVRTAVDAEQARLGIERVLAASDSVAVREIHTAESSLAVQIYPFEISYWIASLIGGVALLLTVTGVYGVLSYLVAQRTREFGIRMALGANPSTLIALVLRQLMGLSAIGIVAGGLLAFGLSRLFGSLVYVIDTRDPLGYLVGIGIVFGSCLLAAYVPSRRAATVNPVEALRADG
ncbi:MAG TPA: ADOP family duplicated permease [Gemmatimonadaceae bacterium]